MTVTDGQTEDTWTARASTSIVPPPEYWQHLSSLLPEDKREQLVELQSLSDSRLNELRPSALSPPEEGAKNLLERVAADGWLERVERACCVGCEQDLGPMADLLDQCPGCGRDLSNGDGISTEVCYIRNLPATRVVDWVVAIHGMNTTGAWQEELSWFLGTTWGRSVPVAVYKYGFVIAGVVLFWRRRTLRNELRSKLATLRDQARATGHNGQPDVIAHSFGTWLLGHLLEEELKHHEKDPLKLGRVILTGCILPPDFPWEQIKDAGLVEEVLNHYGSKDSVVPFAHSTILSAGPSGRRGFDGQQVINICARGYGHSDLFNVKRYVVKGKHFQKPPCPSSAAAEPSTAGGNAAHHLSHAYRRYWHPFLTLPASELRQLPDQANPEKPWRPLPAPLRGTVFPVLAVPLVLALVLLLAIAAGKWLGLAVEILARTSLLCAAGVVSLLAATGVTMLWRWIRG